MLLVNRVKLKFANGFEKAAEDRQRSTQFMRDIGHEIATHLVQELALGDILYL